LVAKQLIAIQYLPTDSMTADLLTKPLQVGLFTRLRAKLLNTPESNQPVPLWSTLRGECQSIEGRTAATTDASAGTPLLSPVPLAY
jgi:hypothetical protein